MAQQVADRRDQDFVIWEQMESEEILKNETYQDFNRKTCDMILTEARALAIKELLQLSIASFQHGQDVGMTPRVHGNAANSRGSHAQTSVLTTALEAQESAIGNAGPGGMGGSTIHAVTISLQAIQQGTSSHGELGFRFMVGIAIAAVLHGL